MLGLQVMTSPISVFNSQDRTVTLCAQTDIHLLLLPWVPPIRHFSSVFYAKNMSLPRSLSGNDKNETIPSPTSILTLELSDVLEFYLELKVRTQKLKSLVVRHGQPLEPPTETSPRPTTPDSPAQTRYQGSAKHAGGVQCQGSQRHCPGGPKQGAAEQ